MPFPQTQRVIYHKNPLKQVICQLRFPTILKIASDPAEFQEAIRHIYPLFEQKIEVGLPLNLQQALPSDIIDSVTTQKVSYEFKSEDGNWAVTLNRDFLALTSLEYERREIFAERLETPLQALVEIYEPAFFSRIGLRYQDVIQRSQLDLERARWSDLLQPQIAGVLATTPEHNVANYVQGTATEMLIGLEDEHSQVRVKHGLIEQEPNDEICYLVDSDFYTEERTKPTDVRTVLEYFGERGSRLFRWCITELLHKAMEPELI